MFKPLLAVIASAAMFLPSAAQAAPKAISCQATIPLSSGASLLYRLQGTVAEPSNNQPQNPIGTILTITVQRRDRNGLKTLLTEAIAEDYEQVAPDADYSQLPFTGDFRGKPNNGFRLYSVRPAAHGLYISLRPLAGQPQKVQIVHYLSPGKFVRSGTGICQSIVADKPTPTNSRLPHPAVV